MKIEPDFEVINRCRRPTRLLSPGFWRERALRLAIDDACPGYSRGIHWAFFRDLIERRKANRILVLGVYFGRDIAYLASILRRFGRKGATIVGVDTFSDTPGADWPTEVRGLGWREAGFGEPPDLDAARHNLETVGAGTMAVLHRATAEEYLTSSTEAFDFIYIDIAHDYGSTAKAIELALSRLAPDGWLGGDDFSDAGTWGVKRAVLENFGRIELYEKWIWLAAARDRRSSAACGANSAEGEALPIVKSECATRSFCARAPNV